MGGKEGGGQRGLISTTYPQAEVVGEMGGQGGPLSQWAGEAERKKRGGGCKWKKTVMSVW